MKVRDYQNDIDCTLSILDRFVTLTNCLHLEMVTEISLLMLDMLKTGRLSPVFFGTKKIEL